MKSIHTKRHCRKILRGRLNLCLLNYKKYIKPDNTGFDRKNNHQIGEINEAFHSYLNLATEFGVITTHEEKQLIKWKKNWTQETPPLTKLT